MDDRLEVALRELGAEIAFPPTPDLRAGVAERIAAGSGRRWWQTPLPRALVLAVIVTLLLAATVAALPGLRIVFVPSPSVVAEPLGDRLALGEPVTPSTVAVAIPSALGVPDEAYVMGDDEVLTVLYRTTDQLPPLAASDVGLLVQRIAGSLDRDAVEKLVPEVGSTVTRVEVSGADAFWITGPPHVIRYITPAGGERAEATRLVGDVLVWERDGALYRIESALGLEQTLRIAETIEPEVP